MKNFTITLSLFLLATTSVFSQENARRAGFQAITGDALKAYTGFLASDWTQGRETGTEGAFMSADFIASMLELSGIKPGGDIVYKWDNERGEMISERSYFQNFVLTTVSPDEKQELILETSIGKTKRSFCFAKGIDFVLRQASEKVDIEAPVVFVGYGYANKEKGYNDFSNINVKDKIIIRLAGPPPSLGIDNSPYGAYRLRMEKNRLARELGAAGILETDTDNKFGVEWLPVQDFLDKSPSENGRSAKWTRYMIPSEVVNTPLPELEISLKTANTILAGSGIDINDWISKGFKNKGRTDKEFSNIVTIRASVSRSLVKVRNVIGILEGNNPGEAIVIGAHYDHLGAKDGYIFNGADDNASGTAGVLAMAKAFSASGQKPEKSIIFALWTGEEKGLLGSRYYVENPGIPLAGIRLNLNFDMISRYIDDNSPNAVTMTYTASCSEFRDITINNISKYNIEIEPDYQPSDNPPGGSDHRSFVAKNIPVMRFKPGHREEYHTPADETETLDWDIMIKIIQLSYLNIFDLANSDW